MNLNDLKLLTKAYEFASIKHRSQKRKNGANPDPYINHPIQVCRILTDCDISDVKILCAAVLHDTLEDTETTEQQLETQFGATVLKYVQECSDDKSLGKVQRKVHQVQHSKHISDGAKYIKIADKISNNSSLLKQCPKSWTKQRVFGYHLWSQAVFKNLEGDNERLNSKMKQVLQEGGVYKHSQEQRTKLLNEYYDLLKQTMES